MMASAQSDVGVTARSRIAWRLLPFLFLLYVANYLDRTNIAYATLGMKGDLGLSDSVFGTASGIFFIGYIGLQIPGALLVERWSARLLLAITLISALLVASPRRVLVLIPLLAACAGTATVWIAAPRKR